jgi:hypothetical protein
MENRSDNDLYEKPLRTEVAGNFCALDVIPIADSEHELVSRYIELMRESPTRKFHSFKYICRCLLYAKDVELKNRPLVIAAILFHKIGYTPGDKKCARRSCEIAAEFYPGKLSVELFRLIKAAQTEESLTKRYGDDRDIVGDIVNYFYGTNGYEEFKKDWSQILLEFEGAGHHPTKFKKFSRLRLKKMLAFAQVCGVYHTLGFSLKYGRQALDNLEQKLKEI